MEMRKVVQMEKTRATEIRWDLLMDPVSCWAKSKAYLTGLQIYLVHLKDILKALKTMKGFLKAMMMHLVRLKKSPEGNRMDHLMALVYIHRTFVGNSHVCYPKLSKHFPCMPS